MTTQIKTVSIIGLGYIGLPTAAVFASRKIKVIGVDVNQHTVDTINQGKIHIVEPDLDMMVHAAVSEGYLKATTKPEPADAFLIAVPTPFKDGPTGPHEPDLSYIEAASKSIASVLKKGDLVILESTSPVGATEQMAGWLAEARPDLTFPQCKVEDSDVRIAYCPERVMPGNILLELVNNDRVIGGMTNICSEAAVGLYKIIVRGECIVTSARTAEMCKLTENSYRDVNIAFANELQIICGELGIDVWELIKLANRHPRVNILKPGPGVGGHCIAVDPWFIVSSAPKYANLIKAGRTINDSKPAWVLNQIIQRISDINLSMPNSGKIGIFGISYKENIDDIRESPAIEIAKGIAELYRNNVYIVEPNIDVLPEDLGELASNIQLDDALDQCDIIVLLVGHKEFREIDREKIYGKCVIDIFNIL